ncbi:hypothetical protein KEM54_003457, partial [Ascosphaera aggregata]
MVRNMNVQDAIGNPPPEDQPYGTTCLPASRVKAIVKQDEEIAKLSNPATFSISIATQLFVEYLTKQAHLAMKSDGRRGVLQYKDVAAAVSRIDNLEFLTDVVPKTTPFHSYKKTHEDEEGLRNGPTGSKGHESTIQSYPQRAEAIPFVKELPKQLPPLGQYSVRDLMMGMPQPPRQKRPSTSLEIPVGGVHDDTNTSPTKRRQRSSSKSTSPVDVRNLINSTDVTPGPSLPKDTSFTRKLP